MGPLSSQRRRGRLRLSEQPGEAAFDAVVGDAVAELAAVGHAGRGVIAQREVEAGVDQRRVLRQRHAVDVKADAGRGKSQRCARCHVTDLVTGSSHPFSELRGQSIKPYTDLLLHDLGPELADDTHFESPADASSPPAASEWRTPPLWGTGLLETINGNAGLLHDGRAATVLEAILWHGGEAEATRERVVGLSTTEREALIAFVMSL